MDVRASEKYSAAQSNIMDNIKVTGDTGNIYCCISLFRDNEGLLDSVDSVDSADCLFVQVLCAYIAYCLKFATYLFYLFFF